MKTKFTEGPWTAREVGHHADGENVIYRQWTIDPHIADVFYQTEEGAANAHLIAASPTLYEVCRQMVNWYENAGNSDPDQKSIGSVELWRMAKAALAKAEGR